MQRSSWLAFFLRMESLPWAARSLRWPFLQRSFLHILSLYAEKLLAGLLLEDGVPALQLDLAEGELLWGFWISCGEESGYSGFDVGGYDLSISCAEPSSAPSEDGMQIFNEQNTSEWLDVQEESRNLPRSGDLTLVSPGGSSSRYSMADLTEVTALNISFFCEIAEPSSNCV